MARIEPKKRINPEYMKNLREEVNLLELQVKHRSYNKQLGQLIISDRLATYYELQMAFETEGKEVQQAFHKVISEVIKAMGITEDEYMKEYNQYKLKMIEPNVDEDKPVLPQS